MKYSNEKIEKKTKQTDRETNKQSTDYISPIIIITGAYGVYFKVSFQRFEAQISLKVFKSMNDRWHC